MKGSAILGAKGCRQNILEPTEVLLCSTRCLLLQLTCRGTFDYIVENGADGAHFIIVREGMRLDWSIMSEQQHNVKVTLNADEMSTLETRTGGNDSSLSEYNDEESDQKSQVGFGRMFLNSLARFDIRLSHEHEQ